MGSSQLHNSSIQSNLMLLFKGDGKDESITE